MPEQPNVHAYLAAAYALNGETERAAAEIAEARRLSDQDRFSSIARLKATWDYSVPKIRALFETTYIKGLRLAGIPEEWVAFLKSAWRQRGRYPNASASTGVPAPGLL
jgi:ferritin-like protein